MARRDTPTYTQTWLLVRGPNVHERRTLTVSPLDFVHLPGDKMSIGKIAFSSFAVTRTFFNAHPRELSAVYCQRLENGALREPVPVTGVLSVATNGASTIKWQFPDTTKVGMCGGIYFSTGVKPSILGVHYAGVTADLTVGISFVPTPEMFVQADKHFLARPGNLLPMAIDPDNIRATINGKQCVIPGPSEPGNIIDQTTWLRENNPAFPPVEAIPVSSTLFPSSSVDLSNSAEVPSVDPSSSPATDPAETFQGARYVGAYPSNAFYKSQAVDTLIADSIRREWPELDFGKPKFGRSMWPKGSAHAINSTPGLPREHLEWAILDYLSVFEENPIPEPLLKTLRPLTWKETVNGIRAVKFIDLVNLSTSMGAAFPGGKRAWIETVENDLGEREYEFVQEVWDQVQKAFEAFERGERVPFLFVATPKDEPTPTNKEKVRLFMVGEIASTLICRRYYTPVIRLLQMLPGWSECCVGLNATSPHWEDLWARFEEFEHVFDGDHAKYDLGMNAVISEFSYWGMIQIASKGDYTAHDLFIMSCIAFEFLLPMCAYKRDVVLLTGSTPSGIPLTVNVNSLGNSLFNRSAYVHCYPNAVIGEFRKFVKHGNYGDDFINAVHRARANFNFLSMQAYLAAFELKITPGIKDAEGKPFVDSLDQLVFLQRYSSRLPELPYRVGKLSEKSIAKQLMCVLQGKGDWDIAAATVDNADNALREWVYHGEEVYEYRRAWLSDILEQHHIRHLSRVVDTPYLELLTHLQREWI